MNWSIDNNGWYIVTILLLAIIGRMWMDVRRLRGVAKHFREMLENALIREHMMKNSEKP